MGEILLSLASNKTITVRQLTLTPLSHLWDLPVRPSTVDWQLFIARPVGDEPAGPCCVQGDVALNDKDFEKMFQNTVISVCMLSKSSTQSKRVFLSLKKYICIWHNYLCSAALSKNQSSILEIGYTDELKLNEVFRVKPEPLYMGPNTHTQWKLKVCSA